MTSIERSEEHLKGKSIKQYQQSDSSDKSLSIFSSKFLRSQNKSSSESATKNAKPVGLKLGSPVKFGRSRTFELFANFRDPFRRIRSGLTKSSIVQTTIRLSLKIAQNPNSVSCDRTMKLLGSPSNLEKNNYNICFKKGF